MQTLYYVAASSSLTLVPEVGVFDAQYQTTWSVDTLVVSSSLGEIVALSGSTTVASFPIASTNLFYNSIASFLPPDPPGVALPTLVPIDYTYIPNTPDSQNKFSISGSNIDLITSGTLQQGGITGVVSNQYTVSLSGSGDFYDLLIEVTNLTTNTTSSYATSSNTPITASFSSSVFTDVFTVVATATTLPYIKLAFSSSTSIPVSPTSSITAWNTYLGVSASYVSSSGNTFYLIGGTLATNTGSIIVTGSGLSTYHSIGTDNITSYTLTNNKLGSFPNVATASSTIYFNVDSNRISGSLPNIFTTQSLNLATFIASNNRLSGSIPALSGSSNLSYFDVNTNYITGTLDLSRCYNLTYFDASNNLLSGSFTLFNASGLANQYAFDNVGNIRYFDISNNALSGALDIQYLTNLQHLDISNNKFGSPITSFSNYRLEHFDCSSNNFTGSFPFLQTVEVEFAPTGTLLYFNTSNNHFTGTINLSDYRITLQTFIANDNKLDNYTLLSGSYTPLYNQLTTFNVQNNLLTSGSVDSILLDLNASGIVSGTVNLSGSGNQPPTATGLAYTASLKTKGWNVYVN